MRQREYLEKSLVDVLMCSTFSPDASGVWDKSLANKLGDQVWSGPHEVLPFHLCVRRVVHDDVKPCGTPHRKSPSEKQQTPTHSLPFTTWLSGARVIHSDKHPSKASATTASSCCLLLYQYKKGASLRLLFHQSLVV